MIGLMIMLLWHTKLMDVSNEMVASMARSQKRMGAISEILGAVEDCSVQLKETCEG